MDTRHAGAEDDEPSVPHALQRDLARYLGSGEPPREVDERALAAAHAELADLDRSKRHRSWPRSWWPVAAAAALLVALGLWRVFAPAPAPARVLAATDIDRNGRVDVLDAFALARALQVHETQPKPELPLAWDVDGDGRVDARDVERVVQDAVKVSS